LGKRDIIPGYHYHRSKIGQISQSNSDFVDQIRAIDSLNAKSIPDAFSDIGQTDV
jgi:hypothetical protein